jgi:pimeloyl-ACP methyl ester carboxylesterase
MNLHFTSIGFGQPIVLLHAFPLDHEMFTLKEIPGYRLILPDFPGFGLSPLETTEYSFSTLAVALKDQLDHFLGQASPFILGGISMGGYLTFEFVREVPESVSKIILISTRSGNDTPEAQFNRLKMADDVLKNGMGSYVESMPQGLLGARTRSSKPQVVQIIQNFIRKANPKAVAFAQRAMAQRRDQKDLLGQIRAKTLILGGLEDSLIQPTESKKMADHLPMSQIQFIEGTGHLIPMEEPELFEKAIRDFVLKGI